MFGAQETVSATIFAVCLCMTCGCATAPVARTCAPERQTIAVPYDIVWDAANQVLREPVFVVWTADPNEGTIVGEIPHASIEQFDCGSVGGAQPLDAKTTFRVLIQPDGYHASSVELKQETEAMINVPLQGITKTACPARAEAQQKIVDQIKQAAAAAHRPTYARSSTTQP